MKLPYRYLVLSALVVVTAVGMTSCQRWIYWICRFNPFTWAVELVRHALYLKFDGTAFCVTLGTAIIFSVLAINGFNPQRAAGGRKPG
jgi:ABC-2 type transport system permease protein